MQQKISFKNKELGEFSGHTPALGEIEGMFFGVRKNISNEKLGLHNRMTSARNAKYGQCVGRLLVEM